MLKIRKKPGFFKYSKNVLACLICEWKLKNAETINKTSSAIPNVNIKSFSAVEQYNKTRPVVELFH